MISNKFWLQTAALLTLLLGLGLLLRVGHWYPGFASDDTNYMNNGGALARGEPPIIDNQHSVRLGYQAFLAAGMWAFGEKTVVCQSLGLGVFVLLSLGLYFLTARLGDSRSALLAVFLLALLPLDMVLSTCALPEPLMTLLALVATLLYLRAKESRQRLRQMGWAFASGLLLGAATSAKETAAFVGLAYAIDLFVTHQGRRDAVAILPTIVAGGLVSLGLEILGFYYWTGNPWYRFSITSSFYGQDGAWVNPFTLREVAAYLCDFTNSVGDLGLHGYLLLIAALIALNRRSKAAILPLTICTILLLYLSFGSASLSHYVLVPHQARYLHTIMVLGCGMTAVELHQVGQHWPLKRITFVVAGLIVAATSLLAAKELLWRGTVPTAEWLGRLDPTQRQKLLVLQTFVPRQALECRATAVTFATVANREKPLWNREFLPGAIDAIRPGQGLVVDRFKWVDRPGHEDLDELEMTLLTSSHRSFRPEDIYGSIWPPYRRWLGLGDPKRRIGRIWWSESAPATQSHK